jgi:hypothetical protein
VEATTRFVATSGSNVGICNNSAFPCLTITYALTQADPGDTIQIAAGTYDTANGETFPLVLAEDLTLTGAGAPTTIIDADGTNRVITVQPGVTAAISGVTITGGGSTNLGGGLFNSATLTLTATIVANQLAGADCFNSGTITSNGFNLDSDNTCNLTGTGDKPGVSNPLLGPLANNGGPTQTHALLTGSPAIDMVLSGCPPPATDQRGVGRPQGTFCDIGAYELQVSIPTLAEWAQLAMLTLLLGGGLFALRRRVRPA